MDLTFRRYVTNTTVPELNEEYYRIMDLLPEERAGELYALKKLVIQYIAFQPAYRIVLQSIVDLIEIDLAIETAPLAAPAAAAQCCQLSAGEVEPAKTAFPKLKKARELKIQKISKTELLFVFPKVSIRVTPGTLGLVPKKGKQREVKTEWLYMMHIIDNHQLPRTPFFSSADKTYRSTLNKAFKQHIGVERTFTSSGPLFRVTEPEQEKNIDDVKRTAANKRYDGENDLSNLIENEFFVDDFENAITLKIDGERGKIDANYLKN